ncbi:MAG: DUF6249 domain-containing protein [Casimicrobiaceae bacterium]
MNRRISAGTRRLVLGTALAAAMAAWLFPHSTLVRAAAIQEQVQLAQAADPKAADARPDAEAAAPKAGDAKAAAKPATPKSPSKAADAAADGAKSATDTDADADEAKEPGTGTDIRIDRHGIRVEKGRKHVTVQGLGTDREYDSFESFVQDSPWLAGLVFMVVLLVFLVPLLIIVLLIWYKVRKNRMLNETMLKLAERGVVPPAEAMAALDANRVATGPTTTPLYEQAKQFRQRAVASDLRKGVILIAVGLSFAFYSVLDDGTPNWIGLILLFLGVGYCVLWFLEDRTAAPRTGGTPPPGGA